MGKQEDQHSASFGYAYIETGVVGCFSRSDFVVELKFSEAGEVAANLVCSEALQTVFIEREVAENFLSEIFRAAQKPEKLSGTRSTTWYYAKVKWKNLFFVRGGSLGEIEVKSSELAIEELELILSKFEDFQKICEFKELLEKGLHRRAIEIHQNTEAFARKWSYLERKYE